MKYFCKANKNDEQLSQTVSFLKTISEKNRLKILCFLKNDERCVCEIVDFLELPQNLVSHHLGVLKKQNIVIARKDGLKVFYSINNADGNVRNNVNFLNSLITKL